jgi:small subunit ribosomal protein S15
MLDPRKKALVIKKFKTHDDDTGSPQVQIAILTEEVKELTDHLKSHKKDFSSRRGLFRKVNQRRKLLAYLAKTEESEYDILIDKLKLKKKVVIAGFTDKEELPEIEPTEEELKKLEAKKTNTEAKKTNTK